MIILSCKEFSKEHRRKLGEAQIGSKNHQYGKPSSPRQKEFMKNNNPMKNPETAKRAAEKRRGSNNGSWNNGSSFAPYCFKFDEPLKQDVRIRDSFQCQFPGCLCTQLESLTLYGDSLHVHHIHYDKQNCYPDLICLCLRHNIKVNSNRKYYESLFMNKLNDRNLLYWIRWKD